MTYENTNFLKIIIKCILLFKRDFAFNINLKKCDLNVKRFYLDNVKLKLFKCFNVWVNTHLQSLGLEAWKPYLRILSQMTDVVGF